MATIDPRKLRPSELCRLLNSTPLGEVISERQRLATELDKLGLSCLPSKSNFLFARSAQSPAARLYESLKARGILVRYFNSPGLDDKLRITVGTPEQNNALLAALAELIP